MASRTKRGKKKAEPSSTADQLSNTMRELSKTKADLNRAELRYDRAEKLLKAMEERVREQEGRASAAEVVTRRMKEEHAVALKKHLSTYQERLTSIGKAASDSHSQIVKLHEEKTALLERLAAAEEASVRERRVSEAERTLREKMEALQKETSEKLSGFVDRTTPLLEHNKTMQSHIDALEKENAELRKSLKDLAGQQRESLTMLTESQLSVKRMQKEKRKDDLAHKRLANRATEAEGMAASALKDAVKDKKEISRLLKRDKQLTQLTSLLQARVTDLEKQRDAAMQKANAGVAHAASGDSTSGGEGSSAADTADAAASGEEEAESGAEASPTPQGAPCREPASTGSEKGAGQREAGAEDATENDAAAVSSPDADA